MSHKLWNSEPSAKTGEWRLAAASVTYVPSIWLSVSHSIYILYNKHELRSINLHQWLTTARHLSWQEQQQLNLASAEAREKALQSEARAPRWGNQWLGNVLDLVGPKTSKNPWDLHLMIIGFWWFWEILRPRWFVLTTLLSFSFWLID